MSAPLKGCRVLDLGIITAGAATSALLADLGAEVIKIESPSYRDPFRGWSGSDQPEDERGFFRFTNRNKVGASIELKRPEGREAFLRLVAQSDIVLENFRRGVMARLRLDYAQLRAVRPDIILASISSQGETGPDTNYVSFGTTLEAMAGLSWLTGYADGEPVPSGRDLNYPDQVVAIFAAGMVVTAWRHRCRTGEGAHLDLSQRELTSFLVGEAFAATPTQSARIGNADPSFALQECFRASDGIWVALSVLPGQVASLDRLIGPSGREHRPHGGRAPVGGCLRLDGQRAGVLASRSSRRPGARRARRTGGVGHPVAGRGHEARERHAGQRLPVRAYARAFDDLTRRAEGGRRHARGASANRGIHGRADEGASGAESHRRSRAMNSPTSPEPATSGARQLRP